MKRHRAEANPSGSQAIARSLMDASTPLIGGWSADDLASLLEHQLRTPLHLEAERLVEHAPGDKEAALESLRADQTVTFFDVLHGGNAEDGVLQLVKDYAKASLATEGELPKEVARFLYVTSILRARAAGIPNFTSLDSASVDSEARRCLTFTWLPSIARDLLRQGLSGP